MKIDKERAFTIVELVIVIAVIAILAVVLIPTFASVIEKANDSKFRQNARNYLLEKAIENYLSDSETEGKASKPSEPEEPSEDTFAMITYSNGTEPRYIKASDLSSSDDLRRQPILENVKDPEIISKLRDNSDFSQYFTISEDDTWDIYLASDGYVFMSGKPNIMIDTKGSLPFYLFYGAPSMLSGLEGDPYQPLYHKWDDFDKNPIFESPKTYIDKDGHTITLTIYG